MSRTTWVETLIAAQGDSTALTNTVTATSILPGSGKLVLPAGILSSIGQRLRVTAAGRISTVVTTPGTLTLDVRVGPASPPTIICANGGAMTLSTTAKTNVAWALEWMLTLRALGNGTSANFMHQGWFMSEAAGATTVVGEAKSVLLPQSAPAVGTGFDSTVSLFVDLFGTWSVANAANSIQTHQFAVELMN